MTEKTADQLRAELEALEGESNQLRERARRAWTAHIAELAQQVETFLNDQVRLAFLSEPEVSNTLTADRKQELKAKGAELANEAHSRIVKDLDPWRPEVYGEERELLAEVRAAFRRRLEHYGYTPGTRAADVWLWWGGGDSRNGKYPEASNSFHPFTTAHAASSANNRNIQELKKALSTAIARDDWDAL
ncbi:hypothetical protein ITJ57_07015 [Plantibacter sp. VKM Ac-2880]|uniref:hypothetical protein n=1 Tax=Plantibacter sp. VKM Ac-2880 TaxID=2783827 RepID=UPI00188E3BBC|nr:hypothetical protein [Plantibacter sp. VKM Ac-2880]MBF4568519.1 hypothetical protein [Plantibacter sp. VKM Ac-2880]